MQFYFITNIFTLITVSLLYSPTSQQCKYGLSADLLKSGNNHLTSGTVTFTNQHNPDLQQQSFIIPVHNYNLPSTNFEIAACI